MRKEQPKLTPREIEVASLICAEYSTKQIASKLKISLRTVEAHRYNIFRKLGVKSSIGLFKYALKSGIVKLD